MLAALELLDPGSETYALDVISMVEATLEDPRQILRVQEKRAKDHAIAEMKADGVEYEERLERLADVTYPKPLEDLLEAAFDQYCEKVPWARDYTLSPKSILRDMLETAADFKGYVSALGAARFEGILLRYLSEAYRSLDRTIPLDKRDDQLNRHRVVARRGGALGGLQSGGRVGQRRRDLGRGASPAGGAGRGRPARPHGARAQRPHATRAPGGRRQRQGVGRSGQRLGHGRGEVAPALEGYAEEHDEILLDADARSNAFFSVDERDEKARHVWHVHQIFSDPEGDHDFGIMADVDLDATQQEGEVVFENYHVGFVEDLMEAARVAQGEEE